MAGYATTNPPYMITQRLGGSGVALWVYSSVDAATLVQVSGYFTNGYSLGMRAQDIVFVIDNDASPMAVTCHVVQTSTASTGLIDLTAGVAVSGSNSD